MSGTLKVTTLQDGASSTANLTFDANGNTTAGGTLAMSSSFLRNRIINGNMTIDQRNAGASVTPTDGQYLVDRWVASLTAASKYTAQQGTLTPSSTNGYNSNSLNITSSSAYSISSSDIFAISQKVEGFNFYDMGWGTASAKTVTLSFWVYSSLTGTFGGCFVNSAQTRAYPFTYTISSANTWTSISVTVPGDTSGTWVGATNGIGVRVFWSLGVGSTYSTTANAWAAGTYFAPTGATSVVGTSGATFYITGVQLEVGTKATPFEQRLYGTELVLCQRYYFALSAAIYGAINTYPSSAQQLASDLWWPVTMRTAPTVAATGTQTINSIGLTTQNKTSVLQTVNNGGIAGISTATASAEL